MQNNYSAIPLELRLLNFWCVWRYEDIGAKKPTKIPYSIKTGKPLDVTSDVSNFFSFEEVLSNVDSYSGLGFIFHESHPYSFIDLDDTEGNNVDYERQLNIFKEFDSYSELSPSGKGLHIIVKGKVPSGRRRSHIEVYSSQRYATMTGNVYNIKPIAERQNELTQLWEQMGGTVNYISYDGNSPEIETDQQILDRASDATNGDKFKKLLQGNWQDLNYPSQSEADLAFIDIVAFYTQNKEQIKRIYWNSVLGNTDKKRKRVDYVEWMVHKSFDKLLSPIDFEGFNNVLNTHLASVAQLGELNPHKILVAGSSPVTSTNNSTIAQQIEQRPLKAKVESLNLSGAAIKLPPGLMGDLARFIYSAAPRPVPEIALAGAIGLMAAICGKAYNVSNTGLNQYILLLAKTGMGKEGMAQGIDKLMNTISMQVPTAQEFIGPSYIASGQALVKYVHKKSNCFVSILGEFGLRLQGMSSQNASTHEKMLKQILLELYNKSGHNDVYRASIHADFDKNTDVTKGPAFSLLGESNPHSFYSALSEDMIAEGLLPRFLMIEYSGNRPDLNKQYQTITPPIPLVEQLATLAANCKNLMHNQSIIHVQLDDAAMKLSDEFDTYATQRINQTGNEVILQLWNRAHLKALKLAALVAVGNHPYEPTITQEHIVWAIDMIQRDIINLTQKFEIGEIGTNTSENKQITEIVRVVKEYLTKSWDDIRKYTGSNESNHIKRMMYDNRIIPYAYISKRVILLAAFKNDRLGATNAIKRTLQILTESDKLREVGKTDLSTRFGTTQKAFIVSDLDLLG